MTLQWHHASIKSSQARGNLLCVQELDQANKKQNKTYQSSASLALSKGNPPVPLIPKSFSCDSMESQEWEHITGLILGWRPANERRRYFVTMSLIGWVQAKNQLSISIADPGDVIYT